MKKKCQRIKRKRRIRKRISGDADRPRLSVYRSNKHIYTQVIDDEKGVTLVEYCDAKLSKKEQSGTKMEIAGLVGRELGKRLKEKNILKVVFDRGGYKYHGRVKALAGEVRKVGIMF